MSRCWDGWCSKDNYAAYVRKNVPYKDYSIILFLTYGFLKSANIKQIAGECP
jgi:hypothetical protein